MSDYPGVNKPHTLVAVAQQGGVVELEDGSRWQIYSGFIARTADWENGDMINVRTIRDEQYPYRIINIHKNESADARPADAE